MYFSPEKANVFDETSESKIYIWERERVFCVCMLWIPEYGGTIGDKKAESSKPTFHWAEAIANKCKCLKAKKHKKMEQTSGTQTGQTTSSTTF